MIEVVLIKYLSGKTSAGDCVYAEKPKKLPEKYILIEKTGSRSENHIYASTMAVQSVAGSMLEATSLNEEVKEALENIVDLDEIGACRLNSDYNFTDETTKEYRYQAVFDITHY